MKIDGSTLEDVHRNVTDILEEAPPSVNKRTKTRASSSSDTYRVTVGSASDVKTRLTSKYCLNIFVGSLSGQSSAFKLLSNHERQKLNG